MTFAPQSTALLIVDLQNDFLHPDGAYGRAGQTSEEIAALPSRVEPVASGCPAPRRASGSNFLLPSEPEGSGAATPHRRPV